MVLIELFMLKLYVLDTKVMHCLFAASEGLMFQAEAARELYGSRA